MKKSPNLRSNQDGLVAIIITMVIMIVLTLIVTGFAQLARRERREALDRQLSTQAYYAAESGINDAQRLLQTPAYKNTSLNKDDCITPNSSLDTNNVNQYACLLINQTPEDLLFQNIQTNKATIAPIYPTLSDGSTVPGAKKLTVAWQNRDGDDGIYTRADLPSEDVWGDKVAMMRIDLVDATTLSTAALRANTFTAFLKPAASGASGNVGFTTAVADQGQIVLADCSAGGEQRCNVSITGLTGNAYYLRMRAIYNVADAKICADRVSEGDCTGNVRLARAQAEIDSTGRASDVLKRIQVRVSIIPEYKGESFIPDLALRTSDNICKLLAIWPAGGTDGCTTVNP